MKPQKTTFKVLPDVDAETQQRLNQPLASNSAFDPADDNFLKAVVSLVEEAKINLYSPSSLLNEPMYRTLTEEQRGKVDLEAFNLLTTLRNIYNLWKVENKATYQLQNLVHQVRLTKERLENISGDVFIV